MHGSWRGLDCRMSLGSAALQSSQLLVTAAAIAVCVATTSAAQELASTTSNYDPVFFARAQPASAYDMIQILPGFRLIEGDAEVRGYSGSAGNILIDGQRPASKEETLEELLKRIPADRVARIELIRGGASGYDMQGYALIANVVRKSGGRLSGRVEAEDAVFRHGLSAPRLAGQFAYDWGTRLLELSAARYREIDDEHGFGRRDRLAADGSPVRLVNYGQPEGRKVLEGTAGYRQPLLGGTMFANALAKDERKFADIGYDISFPAVERITGSERARTRTYEGALRFKRSLGASSEIELVGSRRSAGVKGEDRELRATGSDRTSERSDASETIVRAALRHTARSVAFEAGGEGAINVLESSNQLSEDGVPMPLPNAQVRVEEKRAELFATSTWQVSSRWALEGALRYEVSRLSQRGDTNLSKSLEFLKPRARVSWVPSDGQEVRALVEREVGQLDFADFVGVASLTGGTITAGNADLEPENLWRAEVAYDRRFGKGSVVLVARREWISDVVDQLPILINGNVFDAVGNIGKARRDEIEANANLPLDGLGLRGVTIKGDLLLRRSRVTDPTTGERRRISNDAPLEAKTAITHDVPQLNFRWGANFVFATETTSFKVGEVQSDRVSNRLDMFVEYKPTPRWTVRAFGKNLTDSPVERIRDLSVGIRGASALKYHEVRTLRSGPYFGLAIQRSFGG